jgi:hypothetical protein
MHAGVRAPGDDQLDRLAQDGRQSGAELALDRALARLDGPPREGGAVIGKRQAAGQTSSM